MRGSNCHHTVGQIFNDPERIWFYNKNDDTYVCFDCLRGKSDVASYIPQRGLNRNIVCGISLGQIDKIPSNIDIGVRNDGVYTQYLGYDIGIKSYTPYSFKIRPEKNTSIEIEDCWINTKKADISILDVLEGFGDISVSGYDFHFKEAPCLVTFFIKKRETQEQIKIPIRLICSDGPEVIERKKKEITEEYEAEIREREKEIKKLKQKIDEF